LIGSNCARWTGRDVHPVARIDAPISPPASCKGARSGAPGIQVRNRAANRKAGRFPFLPQRILHEVGSRIGMGSRVPGGVHIGPWVRSNRSSGAFRAASHRYNMTRSTTSEEVPRLLQREWNLRFRLQMLHGIKTGARIALGTSAYHWVGRNCENSSGEDRIYLLWSRRSSSQSRRRFLHFLSSLCTGLPKRIL